MTMPKTRALVVLALAAACGEPGNVPQTAAQPAVTAVFDPTTASIPLPNDLARAPAPPGTPALPAAQQELLNLFNSQGGFPSDQELPVTISLVKTTVGQSGVATKTAPTFDPASVNAGNLVVFLKTATSGGLVAIDPITDANYVSAGDHGVLSIHNRNRAPWAPGQYVVGLRGGPNGVKTKEGEEIHAAPTFYFVAQGHKLVTDQDLAAIRAQTGSEAEAQAAAAQLNALIDAYTLGGVYTAVNQVFPHEELAALTAFTVAPVTATVVEVDPGRGIVPLPIDLLRDPSTGKLTPLAACTLAGGTLSAQGACSSAAAAGFAALDGFSTTGMILAQTSDLITASTVTSSTVQLWEIPSSGAPVQVSPTTYITEPVEVTQSGFSPAIALQPAGATAADPTSVLRTRPLKDNTDYAVVISDGVKDKTGASIGPGTVARIVRFTNPISVSGKSQLIGIDDVTAAALEKMRNQLPAVINASGFGSDHVVMAYVFHTQTILSTATQLGALPYTKAATTGNTGTVTGGGATAAFAKYGVNGGVVPSGNIAEIIETTITTFNLLDPATGAFVPTGTTTDETINVLIARPAATNSNVPACAGPLAPFGKCSPLVVFRHGLASGRAAMLAVADTFTGRGFTVAAIDAAKHGDRSFCTSGQTQITAGGNTLNQCAGGGVCTALLPAGAQGDANVIGTCGAAGFDYLPVSTACLNPATGCNWTGGAGIPAVSSNYLVSANFFRTRDTFRQDMIDQSQLVRAVAFAPTGAPPTGHNLFDHMIATGVIIDPTKIYFVGQSLGAIQGTGDVAVNPRISTAVLNVGGGTVVDVFTTSPAFATTTNTLLASLGIQPGANSAYLQFLVVAKTILDPADPVNFAGHLTANTLPNLLVNPNGTVAQSAKAVLRQVAFCDQVVPNPFNFILYSTVSPFTYPPTGAPGTFQLFFKGTPNATTLQSCPAPTSGQPASVNSIAHAFFTDWASGATARAQSDAAAFLVDPAANQPPSLQTF